VKWQGELATGKPVSATIPEWLASKHRQLVGDEKFDAAKEVARPLSNTQSSGRDMSGALFRNQRKDKDSQPDYNGDVMIGGTKYRLAGWLKEGKNGKRPSESIGWRARQVPQQEGRWLRPRWQAHHF
jgi:hypothetical protein